MAFRRACSLGAWPHTVFTIFAAAAKEYPSCSTRCHALQASRGCNPPSRTVTATITIAAAEPLAAQHRGGGKVRQVQAEALPSKTEGHINRTMHRARSTVPQHCLARVCSKLAQNQVCNRFARTFRLPLKPPGRVKKMGEFHVCKCHSNFEVLKIIKTHGNLQKIAPQCHVNGGNLTDSQVRPTARSALCALRAPCGGERGA